MEINTFMDTTKKKLPAQCSIRWDKELQPAVEKWLEKNPGWTISRLANQAVRKFVLVTYSTDAVKIVRSDGTKVEMN